jgi:hypothetical protein
MLAASMRRSVAKRRPLISAWLDLPLVPTELIGNGRMVELPRVEMVFKNASDEAVYHVMVCV